MSLKEETELLEKEEGKKNGGEWRRVCSRLRARARRLRKRQELAVPVKEELHEKLKKVVEEKELIQNESDTRLLQLKQQLERLEKQQESTDRQRDSQDTEFQKLNLALQHRDEQITCCKKRK